MKVLFINNDGGGIFSFLPVAECSEHFETHFGTPHGMNFRGHAEAFGLPYMQPGTTRELAAGYASALDAHAPSVRVAGFGTRPMASDMMALQCDCPTKKSFVKLPR